MRANIFFFLSITPKSPPCLQESPLPPRVPPQNYLCNARDAPWGIGNWELVQLPHSRGDGNLNPKLCSLSWFRNTLEAAPMFLHDDLVANR